MGRLPYSNFHDMNLDWVLKQIKTAYTADNPPPYPVKSVNGMTGNVTVTGDVIPIAPNNSDKVSDVLREKQDAPASPGNPGQVLGLNANQTPVWIDQTGGVTSYDELTGKPSINGVPLSGEMEGTDLGLIDAPSVPGTAGQVLTSDGQGGQSWQTPVTPPAPGAGDYAPIIMDSASGPVASFPDGADGLYMPSLVAEIVPEQAGTGDPSPSNIRAISGRGGLSVYRAGANLLNLNRTQGTPDPTTGTATNPRVMEEDKYYVGISRDNYYIPSRVSTFTVESNKISLTSANNGYGVGFPVMVKGGSKYTFSGVFSTAYIGFGYYDADWNNIGFSTEYNANTTITVPANCTYLLIVFFTHTNESGSITNPQLEYGETAHTYQPFVSLLPILEAWGDIAGNIFGGTLDVISGVLTVDWNLVTLNGTEIYNNYTNVVVCRNIFPKGYAQNAKYIISSAEKYPNIQFANQNSRDTFQFNKTAFGVADAVELKALFAQLYASNTPVTIAYKLETSLNTYQLTPQQVQTILGQNNIYSDSGDCSITYRADTKLFILKVIA